LTTDATLTAKEERLDPDLPPYTPPPGSPEAALLDGALLTPGKTPAVERDLPPQHTAPPWDHGAGAYENHRAQVYNSQKVNFSTELEYTPLITPFFINTSGLSKQPALTFALRSMTVPASPSVSYCSRPLSALPADVQTKIEVLPPDEFQLTDGSVVWCTPMGCVDLHHADPGQVEKFQEDFFSKGYNE